jgi:RNA exonuclease 1
MILITLLEKKVTTSAGAELCRVSIIDANRNVMYDTLVKPRLPVVDYLERSERKEKKKGKSINKLTSLLPFFLLLMIRWSGVNQEMLDPITTTLEDVQLFFKRNFSAETVILGHSLENDFNALKVPSSTLCLCFDL